MTGVAGHLLPLIGLTFLLGLRHGMDPDHLAIVDNLTRFNAARNGHARWCGLFFSIGHGGMVTLVAALLALAASAQRIPAWVEAAGSAISVFFLFAIGMLNLIALARSAPHEPVAPRGLRASLVSGLMRRTAQVSHPLLISLIGAVFAISMDTMSQAAVFSLAASGQFAWGVAILLGLVFTLGMLLVDAASGLWVHRLIHGASADALWSRRLTLAIALLSLGIAAFGVARLLSTHVDAWYDANALHVGIATMLLLMTVFLLGRARQVVRREEA